MEVAFAFGETPMHLSLQVLRRGCDILVATIGRLGHYIHDGIVWFDFSALAVKLTNLLHFR